MIARPTTGARLASIAQIERVARLFVIASSGCWEVRSPGRSGYGRLYSPPIKKTVASHRWMYELIHGTIDQTLSMDHLCRNRSCVNPVHLEAVTTKENVLRGVGVTAVNSRKTHCNRGHEFTPENTVIQRLGRLCRKCMYMGQADYMSRKKARAGKLNERTE